jgi:hypothetical protein
MRVLLSGVLLAVLGIGAAQGQALPPGTTMHRSQAGTLDASGWTHADSTMGAFSVSLPCLFNDFVVNVDQPDKPTRRIYALGCAQADGKRFAATRLEYRGGEAQARAVLDKVSGSDTLGPVVGHGKQHGLDYIDRKTVDAKQCTLSRIVHTPPDNLMLAVEAPDCAGLDKLAAKFFASLVVKPRP